jgi:hypothetical protein
MVSYSNSIEYLLEFIVLFDVVPATGQSFAFLSRKAVVSRNDLSDFGRNFIENLYNKNFQKLVYEERHLLGHDTMQSGRSLPMFRKKILPPSSGRKLS